MIVLLIIQNVSSLLIMKKDSPTTGSDGKQAITIAVVAMAGVFKVTACLLEILVRRRGLHGFLVELNEGIVVEWKETYLLVIPSLLYACQNNVHFVVAVS